MTQPRLECVRSHLRSVPWWAEAAFPGGLGVRALRRMVTVPEG
jgi:hypothetical protein